MMYDELIDALRYCADTNCTVCPRRVTDKCTIDRLCTDAANAIEKLERDNKDKTNHSFVLTGQDLFGRYANIAYGNKRYGTVSGVQDYHIYKVIQRFRSNAYCDVPLTYQTEHNCYIHDEVVDVVNVIHCGIDESNVIRVALKDIELIPEGAI